jgi:hypothetical protein
MTQQSERDHHRRQRQRRPHMGHTGHRDFLLESAGDLRCGELFSRDAALAMDGS